MLDSYGIDTILAIATLEAFQSQRSTAIALVANFLDDNSDSTTTLFLRGQMYERLNSYTHVQAEFMRIIDSQDHKVVEEGPTDQSKGY